MILNLALTSSYHAGSHADLTADLAPTEVRTACNDFCTAETFVWPCFATVPNPTQKLHQYNLLKHGSRWSFLQNCCRGALACVSDVNVDMAAQHGEPCRP